MNAINSKALFDKINALPPERVAEIADFVDFIGERENERSLSVAAATSSHPALAAVWDNSEDDIYNDA